MHLDHFDPRTQSAIAEAAKQFERAKDPQAEEIAQSRRGGYRMIMVGFDGCASSHDYRNLNQVQGMGISVEYINVNLHGGPVRPALPFREIPTRNWQEARRLTDRYGLGPDAALMALVGPDNRTIRIMNSNDRDFPQDVMREIERHSGRGTSRGRNY